MLLTHTSRLFLFALCLPAVVLMSGDRTVAAAQAETSQLPILGGEVFGLVADESGLPIPNAEVRLHVAGAAPSAWPFGGFSEDRGLTAADGTFLFDTLNRNDKYDVSVTVCGYSKQEKRGVSAGTQMPITFALTQTPGDICRPLAPAPCKDTPGCEAYALAARAQFKNMPDSRVSGPAMDKIFAAIRAQCLDYVVRQMKAAEACHASNGPASQQCARYDSQVKYRTAAVCELPYAGPSFDRNVTTPPLPTVDQAFASLKFQDGDVGIDKSCDDFYGGPFSINGEKDQFDQSTTFPLPPGASGLSQYSTSVTTHSGPNARVDICMLPNGGHPAVRVNLHIEKQASCFQVVGANFGPGSQLHAHVVLHATGPWFGPATPALPSCLMTPPGGLGAPPRFPPPGHWTLVTLTGAVSNIVGWGDITVTTPSGTRTVTDTSAPPWKAVQDAAALCKDLGTACPLNGNTIALPWNTTLSVNAPMDPPKEVNN